VLLPPPFFPEYLQEDLREFFLQFAAQLGGGIDVYVRNNGGPNPLCRTTVLDLLRTGRFTGIADRDVLHNDATAISCDDANFPASRRAGIPADLLEAACAVPELAAALNRAAGAKRADDSPVEAAWSEFAGWVSRFPRPALVKAALSVRGLKTGACAVPLTAEKQRDLDRFAEWFRAWLPGVKRLCANA
jgi:dihydrodipicolinate synthase/N-acetylneuraminate lyase